MRVCLLAFGLAGCLVGVEDPPPQMPSPAPQAAVATASPGCGTCEIPVLQAHHIDRPTEVLGIIDVHAPVGREDLALAQMRSRAAAMGADAVVGAEFHHGEGGPEPTHLSGMAVRFISFVGDE